MNLYMIELDRNYNGLHVRRVAVVRADDELSAKRKLRQSQRGRIEVLDVRAMGADEVAEFDAR